MRKISVTVLIPAIHGSYEFLIPDNMAVSNVLKLLVRIMNSERGTVDNSENVLLIDRKDGKSLRTECNFRQQGITDGTKLVLL